jgi:hypothetical protein
MMTYLAACSLPKNQTDLTPEAFTTKMEAAV